MPTLPSYVQPSELNLAVQQGSDFNYGFTFKDENGDLIDLTGTTWEGKIRENFASASSLASFSFDTSALAVGFLGVILTDTQTAALVVPVGTPDDQRDVQIGYYDVECTANGLTTRVLQGSIILSREATKSG
jgi:hypothetical protein